MDLVQGDHIIMSLNLTSSVESLRQDRRHRFATLWEIERTDGTTFRFTDHDVNISYGGNTYTPVGGFSASARQKQADIKTQNLELVGLLESASITHDDLRAGLFREAKITEILVDWLYPWAGAFQRNVYWIVETTYNGENWEARLEDIARWLTPRIGDLYNRVCRHELGDTLCGVPLSLFTTATKTVTQVDTARRIFRTSGLSDADDFYNYGKITWATGKNANVVSEIKDYTDSNNIIELQLKTPFDVEIGDTFVMIAGCDKLETTCKTKFTNFLNFGGFPTIPGTDRSIQRPKIK